MAPGTNSGASRHSKNIFLDFRNFHNNLLIKEALNGMSVDVIEQLTNGMKILLSDTADLDQKVPLLCDGGEEIEIKFNFSKTTEMIKTILIYRVKINGIVKWIS